jgi:hypothetical protein
VNMRVVEMGSCVHRRLGYIVLGIETSVECEHDSTPRKMHPALGIQDYWLSQFGLCSGRRRGRHIDMSPCQSGGGMAKVSGLAL